MSYFSTHNHSSYSNAKVGLDSINRIEEMIKYANDVNLAGIVLSDHELLSGHIKFIQEYQKLKKEGELREDFKIGLGNEVYVVLENDIEELKENQADKNPDSQFYHFLLVALNSDGHYQLRQLSSIAWENSWRDGLVERTPTFLKDLRRIIQKGDVVASSACLGGSVPQFLLKMRECENEGNQKEYERYKNMLDKFITDCIDIFGKEHFYLEIQPSENEEQVYVNKEIIKLSKETGLKYTVATDAHYLKKEDRASHKYYLLAQNIAREVDAFYDATYIMSEEEVKSYLDWYLTETEIQSAFDATMEIYDKVEFYDLHHKTVIPRPDISPDFKLVHKLEPAYESYEYIKKFAYSEHIEDRYYWSLVQDGLIEKIIQKRKADKEFFHQCLDRVNTEFRELWLISERLGDRMSAYYGLTEEVVQEIWTNGDSLTGVARGCFAPESNVLMSDGSTKPIASVNIGESVISHTGEAREVKDVLVYPAKEELTRVKIAANDPIECTKDHKFYGIRVNPCTAPGSKTVYCTATCPRVKTCAYKDINELEWIQASDLKRGDYVVYPKVKLKQEEIPVIDVLDYFNSHEKIIAEGDTYHHIRGTNNLPSPKTNRYIDFNNIEHAWFAGAFIGNGWSRSDGGRIGIAFHSKDREKIERATKAMRELTGREPSLRHHKQRHATQVEVSSIGFNAVFTELFGKNAKEKRIPSFFINSVKDVKKALLQGLFDTDGHYSELDNVVAYSSTSLSLVTQIKMLMSTFGFFSSVGRYVRKEEKWNDEFRLKYSGKQVFQLKEKLFPNIKITEKRFYRNEFTQDDNFFYCRVGSVDALDYEGKVYDLTIDKDSSYIVNQSVVHNSASGYFTNFLSGIVQISALDYDLPHFRHLTAERVELPDVDLDSEQGKREKILQALIDKYGRKRLLNIATFTTEGSRSALLTAARGMQIDISEVGYLTSLMPVERGFTWSLSDCFYGNEELHRKPVAELANAVEKYPQLKETALKIEGLIKSRSIHASGLYIYNDDYTMQNAMMKANNGQYTTQFDMKSSDYMGGLKLDLLTVEGIDRIRVAMDLLVEHGYIEDQGSLQETYNAYLHPDVLEYRDKEMWKKVANTEVPDLFQFETPVGGQCARKTKPQTVEELASANSLMRLMAEDGGEQPIDKFVRHKESIEEWYKEMEEFNLTEDEIDIMKEHTGKSFGVSSSQEEMMLLLMDDRICGFTIAEANIARQVVGRKEMERIPEIKEMVFSKGRKNSNLPKYVWETQILPQLGYSFSQLHSSSYSLIALQQLNLAHLYPRVFWDTACLTVSAGANENNQNNKSTDYGRISSAIGKMFTQGVQVTPPLINQAGFGFIPDDKNSRIVFGLKGINSVNDDVIRTIIEHRPYASFEDFHERMYTTKTVTRGQMLMLIKAGCFNEFDSSVEIMKRFIIKETPVREALNGQNLSRVINLGLFDTDELSKYRDYFRFRVLLKKNVHKRLENPKNRILLLKDEQAKEFFNSSFSDTAIHGYKGSDILIDEKEFEKEYKKLMKPAMDLLKDRKFVRKFNIAQFHELWNHHASGSIESWYFQSVSFYPENHELEHVDEDRYGLVRFDELSETPVVLGERKTRNGRIFKQLELYSIAGTVLDKNRNSHSITVLTKHGIVVCKTYSGAFAHYDRQIKIGNSIAERSWFTRGELLVLQGFRRDDQFVLRASRGGHSINRITEVRDDGTIGLQTERVRA